MRAITSSLPTMQDLRMNTGPFVSYTSRARIWNRRVPGSIRMANYKSVVLSSSPQASCHYPSVTRLYVLTEFSVSKTFLSIAKSLRSASSSKLRAWFS